MNVKNGFANNTSNIAPMLLITGSSGTGKSWLIQSITELTELTELMELETLIKAAFMGIAALNIDGYKMNFLICSTRNERRL